MSDLRDRGKTLCVNVDDDQNREPSNYRILLVEDDASLASMVADFLAPHGFDVGVELRGDAAVGRITKENPDAVLLDVNLPGMDGFSVCRAIRPNYRGAIIILTARGEESDEVVGFGVGADDYITKPARPRALLSRLNKLLRRSVPTRRETTDKPFKVGALVVDPSRRVIELDDTPLELTSSEFDLLRLLAENAGRTLCRDDIYQELHGIEYDSLDRSIDLRISRLRKKLGDDPIRPRLVKSVRGVGYILAIER